MSSARLDAFAVCAPGLERIVAGEIERLGVRAPRARRGGVEASVTVAQLWSLNLRLRCATRVIVRVGRIPAASGFAELQAGLRRLDWSAWLPSGTEVAVKVASSGSKLFHTDAIAERAAEVLVAAGYPVVAPGAAGAAGTGGTPVAELQVVHLRLVDDVALVSLDASGAPLYRRGWRLETARAPMRETLAAALVIHSGWDRRAPLIDPFCGSGTIAIEAALAARRIAAGRGRDFAFRRWANFDPAGWQRLLAGADADVVGSKAPIIGADRDPGAIAAARANAERAGVGDAIEWREASISALELPARPGWIVTNPPYGQRVDGGDLRNLYDRLATVLGERATGWHLGLIAAEDTPANRLPIGGGERLRTTNGGIAIELVAADVAAPPAA